MGSRFGHRRPLCPLIEGKLSRGFAQSLFIIGQAGRKLRPNRKVLSVAFRSAKVAAFAERKATKSEVTVSLPLRLARAMKMHQPPARRLPLPDAGLLRTLRQRLAAVVLHLHQPDVAQHGHVAQQADVGGAEGEVVSAWMPPRSK